MVWVGVNLRRTVPTTGRAKVIISVNWIVLDYRGHVVLLMKSRGVGGGRLKSEIVYSHSVYYQSNKPVSLKPSFPKHKHKSFMSSENERDESTSTRKRKILLLVLMLTSVK